MVEVLIHGFVLALSLVLTAQAVARPPLLSAMVTAEATAVGTTPASPLTDH